jgi:5-methylcytosine-specific restriction endonuclease McrA
MPSNDGLRTSEWRRVRAEVLAASDFCYLCGFPGADSVDHLIPRSKGGTNDRSNLAPAHVACNARKGDRLASSYYRDPRC